MRRGRSWSLLATTVAGLLIVSCHMLSGHADLQPRKAALGQACAVSDDCENGECVEGVCCGNPCLGPCRACNLTDSPGVCTPVPAFTPDGDCGDGVCDGSGSCASGLLSGVRWYGAGRDQQVLDVALGPLDEVMAVGRYVGGIDGVPPALPSIDDDAEPNQWRAGLTVNGNVVEAERIEAPDAAAFVDDIATAVLADGTVLVARTRRIGDERDVWLQAQQQLGGANTWSLRLGQPGVTERVTKVVAAPDGDAVLLGTFGSQLDLGQGDVLAGGEDGWFVVKLSPDGTPRWGRVLRATTPPGGGVDEGSLRLADLAVAGTRIAVVGDFEGTVDVEGTLLVSPSPAALVAVFDLDGDFGWAKAPTFGGVPQPPSVGGSPPPLLPSPVLATHVAVTPDDDVVVAFAGGGPAGTRLARYDGGDATERWTLGVGPPLSSDGSGFSDLTALAVGADGNLHLGVTLNGRFDVAGQRFDGLEQALVLRANANGGYLAASSLGQGRVGALAVDSHGDLVVGASLSGVLGPAPLDPLVSNGLDAVVLKLRADGEALWRRVYGDGGKPVTATSVASTGADGPLVGGVVSGELAFENAPFVGAYSGCAFDGFIVRPRDDGTSWDRTFRGCFNGGPGVVDLAAAGASDGWVFALGTTGSGDASRVEVYPPLKDADSIEPQSLKVTGFLHGRDPTPPPPPEDKEDEQITQWSRRLSVAHSPRLVHNGAGGVVAAFVAPTDPERSFGAIEVVEVDHRTGAVRWSQVLPPGIPEACGGAPFRCLRDVDANPSAVAFVTWATSGPSCEAAVVRESCVTVVARETPQSPRGRIVWSRGFEDVRLDAVTLGRSTEVFSAGSIVGDGVSFGPGLNAERGPGQTQVGVMTELSVDGHPLRVTDLRCLGLERARLHATDLVWWEETLVVAGQSAAPGAPVLPVPGGPNFPDVDHTFVAKLGFGRDSTQLPITGCPSPGVDAWRPLFLHEARGLSQQPPRLAVDRDSGRVYLAGSTQAELRLDDEPLAPAGELFLLQFEP